MKHYTQTIPFSLAEKLKERGMVIANVIDPITREKSCRYTYAEVFDWLIDKGFYVELYYSEYHGNCWMWKVDKNHFYTKGTPDWCETADAAIEKALELI